LVSKVNNSAITIKKCVEEFASYESLKRKKQKEKVFTKGVLYDFSDQVTAEWYIADLFDITNLITCGVAKRPDYVDEGIPFLSAQNARPFKTNLNKIRYIDEDTFNKITVGGKPEKGDILYTRVGNCGEAATIPYDFDFGVYVSLTLIKPNKLFLDSDYLTAFLNSRFGVMQASQGAIGSGLKNLNVDNVRRYKIPLPPIAEQKRIVEKLDSLLAQVDTIKQRLNNLPKIIKRFRQSVLAAAVSGKLTEQWRGGNKTTTNEMVENILLARKKLLKQKIAKDHTLEDSTIVAVIPDTWLIEPLGKLTSYITSGSRGWSKFYSEDPKDAKFVRSAEINNDYLRLDEAITVKLPLKVEGKRSLIEKGDLLLTITGANVGKCAHIEVQIPEAYVSQSVALIKSIDPNISRFLHMWLKAKNAGGSQLEEMMYGIGRPVLSLPNIYSIRVGVPSLEEQTEIVRLVEQHFALADTLEKNLKNAKQRVDNLTQSILAKAFKGELVPQDPSDEPAEQLLARIKTARAEAELLEKAAKKVTSKTKRQKGVVS
jgi:type I restriction enzyme S subunit